MGRAAKGTVLQIGNGSATETFTNIFEVRDISGGGLSADLVDTTHHGSDVEELSPSIIRTQELSFQVNWNPRHATHGTTDVTSLRENLLNRTKRSIKLLTPAATDTGAADSLTITGYVTQLNTSYAVGDGMFADVVIKPVGPTFNDYATATGTGA